MTYKQWATISIKMIKKNTANSGLLGFIEKLLRIIPHVYLIFRPLIKFTNLLIFLKKIFFILKIYLKIKKLIL